VIAREGISMAELTAWMEDIDTTRSRSIASVTARLIG